MWLFLYFCIKIMQVMMIAVYILIGVAVGAVVLYLLMDRKMDTLRIAGGQKDIELSMKGEQLSAATSRVNHLEAENRTLHAKAESQGRELELVRQQMSEELKRHEERFKNMAQQLMETSASKLKESNTEAMMGITQPLKEVMAEVRKAIHENDETGKEMQPDVILHYPQGQDAIIDSKVSLVAYEKYVNAETPEEKERYLQDHIKSVRQHVNELARKDYSKYIKNGRETVDFVIMFVPFESSLQLALANDPTLWREAFEKKVFVTGEQNLLGILHMIHIAWVQNQQAENQEKVFGLAEQLLDRLGDFVQRYNDLGEKLHKVQEAYDSANNKLITGRQSVAQKGRELVDLGAKENANRKIPMPEVGLE